MKTGLVLEGGAMRWMQASASMPFVSRGVKIGERQLLDGGISDSIPVNWFCSIGYEKNLVVLTRPEGYRKKPPGGSRCPGWNIIPGS